MALREVERWLGVLALDSTARRVVKLGWGLVLASLVLSVPFLVYSFTSFEWLQQERFGNLVINLEMSGVLLALGSFVFLAVAKWVYRDLSIKAPARVAGLVLASYPVVLVLGDLTMTWAS